MKIRESRDKIESPPANATSLAKSTSHCSKCSHCHPRSESSISSSTAHSTIKARGTPPKSILPSSSSPPPNRLVSLSTPHFPATPPPGYQHTIPHQTPFPMQRVLAMPVSMHGPRFHPLAPAPVLHNLGRGPEPLFGWESVMPLNHGYGQPKYIKRVKPDYRRFCFSVGKADVPFAAMPGGPLWGMDVTMAPQTVGGHRW